tara:strand:+ start:784 stop:1620 length:837 start_codon:yes stop_codon:yes gene_type:complete
MSEQVAEQVAQPDVTALETPAEVAQGGSGNDFLSLVPEELRDHPSLSPIKDVSNLARSYVNAQRLIGTDKLPLPANPTDEDLDNIYSRLGRPETPEEYGIQADGNVLTEDATTRFKEIAHALRFTPDQATGILNYYLSEASNSAEGMQLAAQEQAKQTEAALRQEWGAAYDTKLKDAQSAIEKFEGDEILGMDLADGTKVGNHPAFVKVFSAIADFRKTVTSEDSISEPATANVMTRQQAQAEVDSIMRSPEYTDRKNVVARQRAIDRVAELMGMIHD